MHIPGTHHSTIDSIAAEALRQKKEKSEEIKNSSGKDLDKILNSHLNLIKDKVLLTLDQEIQHYIESLSVLN